MDSIEIMELMPARFPRIVALLLVAVALLATAACGGDPAPAAEGGEEDERPTTLRLGYFPNITHATAIAGVERGIFEEALGDDELEVTTFNAGPAAVEALFSGAIDATYIGPNPAINAFVQSKGEAIRIISGATSGGAALVVRPGIDDIEDLRGKKIATPQLGNTQDVALRHHLKSVGIETTKEGGDASIVPQENAQTLDTFTSGAIQAAWVPEPWATRLVNEGGGKVLLDEKELWPEGEFVTTHLVVRTEFLEEHPDTVRRLLDGQVAANAFVNDDTAEAQKVVNAGIAKITGKPLGEATLTGAWKSLRFTNDPIAASLAVSAEHATAVGLLDEADLDGIYDLDLLNAALQAAGEPAVQGP